MVFKEDISAVFSYFLGCLQYTALTSVLYCFNFYKFVTSVTNKLYEKITNPEGNLRVKYYTQKYQDSNIYYMKLYDPKEEHTRVFRSTENNFPKPFEQELLELMSTFSSNILSVMITFTTLDDNKEEVEHSVEVLEFLESFLYSNKQIILDKDFLTMYIELTSEENISNLNTIDNLNILLVHKDMDIISSKIFIDVDNQLNITIKELED